MSEKNHGFSKFSNETYCKFAMSSVILAFEINLDSCLDKQAENGITEIDRVGTKPNSGFTSLYLPGLFHLSQVCL